MSNLTWKILHSEYIHKGPWATLRTDKCEMPDGRVVDDYYVLEISKLGKRGCYYRG